MMQIKRKLATPISLIAAGLLAMSIFAVPAGDTLRAAEVVDKSLVPQNGILRIAPGSVGKTRNIRIVPGKAVVLELPREVRDVLIANPKALDAVVHTSKRVYLIGKNSGQTNAIFFSADGERILTLNVEIGGGRFFDLESIFKRIMPGSDIHIEAVGNTVLLTGSVKTPVESARASSIANSYFTEFRTARATAMSEGAGKVENKASTKIVNMLAVEAREQVMLKVQVIEMNREIIKQLGVDLNAALEVGGTTITALSRTPFSALGKELFGAAGVAGLVPGASHYTPNGIAGRFGGGSSRLTGMIKAMERNGMTRTLAEPNLTAISGESAKFHVGGEMPIPVGVEDNKVAVEWKEFGVLLNFTPVVLGGGRISLQIKSEVSELSQEGAIELGYITLPGIAKRVAESTVELPSGGSMMMAGLISQKTRQAVNGLPGLKNLPILGSLFRSRDYVKQESELVIIVTPYIVKPVANRKLTTPDVGYAEASDAKANLLGHFNRVYGRRQKMPTGRQHGDYGFIVE